MNKIKEVLTMFTIYNPRIQISSDGRFPVVCINLTKPYNSLIDVENCYLNKKISNIVKYLYEIPSMKECKYFDNYDEAMMKCMETEFERYNYLQRSVEVTDYKRLRRIPKAINRYFNEFSKQDLESNI